MVINSKFAYVKKKETFEPLITTIPKGLNPIVFIEDTREIWTCGTYFSIGYPSIEVSESSGSVKVNIGNSFFLLSTAGESISVRKGDGNRIIISSKALNRVDTEAPLTWDTTNRKLLHMDSGVAPGSYGQSTNLGNASVFIVPNIMIDSTGHITYAQNYNVEIRDYVEQLAPSTLAGNRNVLLSYNADSESMDTSQVRKANGLLFNDSTQRLTVEGGLDTNGPVFVNHGDLSVLDGYIIGHLKGDVEGEAKPKIHLSNKPEYGGASINLYGHVKLQDILNNKPEPSSDNENINDVNVVNAIAASPLMVWNAIQTAKDYADSILGSNNAMLYKGSLEAGITYPGTYTPTGQIGNTYIVTFGSGNYIDSIGYINGEPVEIGDLVICKEDTPAATSTTWETVKSKWTYVQTNNTGVVSGPSSSTIGQLAVFNNTKGKLIKGLPNGNVGQILSIDESGIPAWVNKPDRLNYALSFQVRGTEFIAFDGYEPKKINFIAGDNMFITSDMQGNLTLAADPGSDTVNTAGATNNPNTKLFLIGAESQTTAPQTYSNQYVYIGPDNKLYSNDKEVSTTDHNHDDRYVNVIGDTMTGTLSITCSDTYPLVLNNSSGHLAIIIKNANTNKSRFGWNQEYGSYIYDYTADKYINIKSDSLYWNNSNPFLHTGNYATTLDTRYVKKSGDSMSGVLSITTSDIHPLVITSSNEQETSINIASKGTIGYHSSKGIFLYNKTANKTLEIDNDGSILFNGNKVWHAGNDGSGSGLDADLLDGVQGGSFIRCDGTNGISLTGGNGNTAGWRLVLERVCGGWTINNISIAVASRHTGQGILHIGFHITNDLGTTYTYNINFNGSTASLTPGPWRAFYNTSTKKFRLFWYYNDYNETIINVLSRNGFGVPSNGTWYTSLPSDNGTELTIKYDSASRLQTARQINGTNFDGTANITTSYWGTARTLTVGNSAKSVNGSTNISWSLSEIGAAAASHTHGLLHDNFGVILANTTSDSGWGMINGPYNGFILKSIRTQGNAPSWVLGNYSAGICFGGGDTKGVISMAYGSSYVRFAGGNGSKPVWYFSLSGVNGASYNLDNLMSKYLSEVTYITNLDSPSWFNGGNNYGISLNSYNGSASNQPGGGDNTNSVLNICNTKHGTSGVYGWQIAFENHEIFARKWLAGNKTGWYKIWHSGNFNPNSMINNNILWASYLVNTGGSGSYSRLSGNYSFITGRTREGTGRLLLTITVPSGYSKTQVMMFATGHHAESHWGDPIYASIQPDYGASSSVRVMTADDSTHNDGCCIVNFILVKTS